jgi:ERCC4-type nuclease
MAGLLGAASGAPREKSRGVPRPPAEKLVKASRTYLVVDARERSVLPFLEDSLKEHAYVQGQINTGDYLVCQLPPGGGPPTIRACVERKTLKDFASSLRDGRYRNVEKMRELRARTGCQLYFFVEGPAFPALNRRFSRIPFANILAATTKLMVRDEILVVQTENERHTAERLADFLRAFDETESAPPRLPFALAEDPGGAPELVGADEERAGLVAERGAALPLPVPEALLGLVEESDGDAVVTMWARLRGVSVVLGKIISREFSVVELAAQAVGVDRVRALRTATGRLANKDAIASLLAVRAGSAEHAAKLVSGLRGVTPAVAELILGSAGSLSRLCGYSVAVMAMISIPQKNRATKLGKKRADRIRRLLHFKEPPHGAPGGDPARAAPPTGHILGGGPRAPLAPRRRDDPLAVVPAPRMSHRVAELGAPPERAVDLLDLVYEDEPGAGRLPSVVSRDLLTNEEFEQALAGLL